MKNVLIINQSAELYGSDKALLELLQNYPKDQYNPIVVLHEQGPLTLKLKELDIQIIETSVIKVKRGILNAKFLLGLPFEVVGSFIKIRKGLKGKKIHVIHSNATSVFIGAFYAFFFRIPHIWHVHEIIEKPKRISLIYPHIINFFSKKVIFNSNATATHFTRILPKIERKSSIIHNGQSRNEEFTGSEQIQAIRKNQFHCKDNAVVIGLIGRISRLKGQKLLLAAYDALLKKGFDNIHLVFIGSAPKGQEFYTENLISKIKTLQIEDKTTILPFTEEIWPIYDSIDIVVVPSTEPESFGLVATEGMLSKKPVIGSNHGGLKEIIVHNETGFLFENKNQKELENYLEELIVSSEKRTRMGKSGLERVTHVFSSEKYISEICNLYRIYSL